MTNAFNVASLLFATLCAPLVGRLLAAERCPPGEEFDCTVRSPPRSAQNSFEI